MILVKLLFFYQKIFDFWPKRLNYTKFQIMQLFLFYVKKKQKKKKRKEVVLILESHTFVTFVNLQ